MRLTARFVKFLDKILVCNQKLSRFKYPFRKPSYISSVSSLTHGSDGLKMGQKRKKKQNFILYLPVYRSGLNRYLTLYKKDVTSLADKIPVCQFTQASRSETQSLSQRSPVTVRERQELLPRMERRRPGPNDGTY